ncbi:MAG TPA: VWA domain-containing protein [Candidatus Koribacter sp.]
MSLFRFCFPLVFGLSLLAAAQDRPVLRDKTAPPPAPAPREADTPSKPVEVKEVMLPLIVRGKDGKPMPTLTKSDLDLVQDGKAQTITAVEQGANQPLTVGLLIDTSGAMRNELSAEKSASHKFIDELLTNPKDQAFVLHFDHEVELLEDVTTSRDQLDKAVELLDIGHTSQDTSDSRDDGRARRGGTQLYDAVFLASNEILAKQPGRKVLIILSFAQDRSSSKETLSDAIEAAQRAEAMVYGVYIKGEEEQRHHGFGNGGNGGPHIGYPGGSPYPGGGGPGGYPGGGRRGNEDKQFHVDGKKVLTDLATRTGGEMLEATKKDSIDSLYSQIADDLKNQLLLAYKPDQADADSGFHRVTLTPKDKELKIQAPEGFYIPEPGSTK